MLIYVLLIACLISVLLQQWTDAAVIFAVVIVNAVIGFIQEHRAEKALLAIRKLLSPTVTVIRQGNKQVIDAKLLVPGDIIQLHAGDRIPADCRLIEVANLQTQEAVLTGESDVIEKSSTAVAADLPISDRSSMAYAGTLVTYGTATAVVVATATETEIGKIGLLLQKTSRIETPLLIKMQVFARNLTAGIISLAGIMLAIGYFLYDYSIKEMFMAAIAFAVAAIPEGLPPVMTITLAIGVISMAKAKAIIRRLPAIETLGSVTVICTDKTGTLTRNEMTVSTVITKDTIYTVTGSGYSDQGDICNAQDKVINVQEEPLLNIAITAAALCNEAEIHKEDNQWKLHGNPTEGALLALAMKANINWQTLRHEQPIIDQTPFASDTKIMITTHKNNTTYIKGAPEKLIRNSQNAQQNYWHEMSEQFAKKGLRILAVAQKLPNDDIEILALFGIIDSAREEAQPAIQECYHAGIAVKMITGDHAHTALAIAKQIGMNTQNGVITGNELDNLDDKSWPEVAKNYTVFARTTPTHKLKLITHLQAQHNIVAMTGDGVNDAPALKKADIGIAMGQKGTEAAKEAAEMVLTDDNFATIVKAIQRGRSIYNNLIKAIIYLLPTSFAEALTIFLAMTFGAILPITPLQVLWVNMVTAITLGISLAFEKQVQQMHSPPRSPKENLFQAAFVWRIGFVTLLMLAGVYGLFWWEYLTHASLAQARSLAVNCLVAFEIVYLINIRYLKKSTINFKGWFENRFAVLAIAVVILLQLFLTYTPIMQQVFQLEALDWQHWSMILLAASVLYLCVEAGKKLIAK